MGVYANVERDGIYTRYLRCAHCRRTDKEVIKSCDVRRRRPAGSSLSATIKLPQRKPITPKTRFDVLQKAGFSCVYCGQKAPFVQLHVDHVVPVEQGGSNELSNLVAACSECNWGKGKRFA